jgi:hypothetical protein
MRRSPSLPQRQLLRLHAREQRASTVAKVFDLRVRFLPATLAGPAVRVSAGLQEVLQAVPNSEERSLQHSRCHSTQDRERAKAPRILNQ